MTSITPESRVVLNIKEAGGLVAIALALGGLLWQVRDHDTRLTRVEQVQTADHDQLVQMKAGIDYLVKRAEREDRR